MHTLDRESVDIFAGEGAANWQGRTWGGGHGNERLFGVVVVVRL